MNNCIHISGELIVAVYVESNPSPLIVHLVAECISIRKLSLGKLLLSDPDLLLLDEPTNHLDINSREALESALLSFDGTIIAVSHDRYFLSKLANRILNFEEGKVTDFIGSYEQFCAFRKNMTVEQSSYKSEETITDSKEEYLRNKQKNAEARKLERKIQNAKDEVARIEKQIDEIDSDIEKYATDYVKAAELCVKKEELETRLLELYDIII